MLHELLLGLSGHPSALFDTAQNPQDLKPGSFPLLSPPEAQLLSSVARLSNLHRKIRQHASHISSSHPSTICRAVATAITSHHLDKFQRKVLDVESRILKNDPTAVGAYNIVPLAGIVGEFAEWTKPMEWLWSVSNFMMPPGQTSDKLLKSQGTGDSSSGAGIIDKLRLEAQTGYPDIEAVAAHLGKVAETAWLRQMSTWVLCGRLPSFGAKDFFVQTSDEDSEDLVFFVKNNLLPKFVSQQTAASILFIGKSLNQIRSLESSSKTSIARSSRASELELLPIHLRILSEVTAPVASAKLSEAIASIRLSLSRNMLQHLLPIEKILEILNLLQEFLLLGRGEFAVALITEAEERLRSRHRNPIQSRAGQSLQGVLLKEGEISAVLSRTWSVLSSLSGEEDHADDALDLAMDLMHLSIQTPSTTRPGTPGRAKETNMSLPRITNVTFNDFLLSVPTQLTLNIHSPLDLFMTNSDLETYSAINAYLLAVRRAHLRLADLWRQSSIRRVHPAPPAPQFSSSASGRAILKNRYRKADIRTRDMRKVWATCGAAVFFLSEGAAYFEGEVVQESWKHFRDWIMSPMKEAQSVTRPQSSSSVGHSSTHTQLKDPDSPSKHFRKSINESEQSLHDPETLATAHRQFLSCLAYSLLLTDMSFTETLREFFTHVDQLVALVDRLQLIQRNLDLEEEGIEENAMTNFKHEEADVSRELDRARKRVDSDLKSLVGRLRDIDTERVGSGWSPSQNLMAAHGYEPWRVGGVDRLLMKLDWGSSVDGEQEDWDDT